MIGLQHGDGARSRCISNHGNPTSEISDRPWGWAQGLSMIQILPKLLGSSSRLWLLRGSCLLGWISCITQSCRDLSHFAALKHIGWGNCDLGAASLAPVYHLRHTDLGNSGTNEDLDPDSMLFCFSTELSAASTSVLADRCDFNWGFLIFSLCSVDLFQCAAEMCCCSS